MQLKEINELRSRMHLDIMAAVKEFESKTALRVSGITLIRVQEMGRNPVICAVHTDVRLP